ncbi:MAG: hypothetical protein KBT66_02190 [Amphritea sp.]|uniref:hypothetical protein n=1 Tax=Amphritea sp. TaxID=1872502 RepID=UPI001B455B84|nr:hypothetical protein [Amphritea sp.]MBQ0757879.1 hypothetical protein [Amphritea sp.]MBQ0783019.1 hypothetical protein [Amphritea sp.]
MGMMNCEDCGHGVSDKAASCVNCGCPLCSQTTEVKTQSKGPMSGAWMAVTKSKTPINLFAIAMMSCSSILGMSAIHIESPEALSAFTYTLHVFMAVTGMFFVTILFCRKGVYHPDDLAKAKRDGITDDLGKDHPEIAAVLIVIMLTAYAVYQGVYATQ